MGYVQADCLDLMRLMPENLFDLAIVDPPYGIGEDGRRKRATRGVRQANGTYLKVEAPISDEIWDDSAPDQEYFDQLHRISRHQIIWGCNNFTWKQKLRSSGRIVWDKLNGKTDFADCEIAWTDLWKGPRRFEYLWSGMMQGVSLKNPRTQRGNKKLNEKRLQHGQKPTAVYQWCVLQREVDANWEIIDTHVGSAASLEVYEKLGIQYFGIEKNSKHFARSNERVEDVKKSIRASLF